jgi:serine/threonine protein phosphatase PrpC
VLEDDEIARLLTNKSADDACRGLIDAANQRGTADNLTAIVFQLLHCSAAPPATGWRARVRRIFRRNT